MRILRGPVAALVLAVLCGACTGRKAPPRPAEGVPVTVGAAERRDVPLEVRAIGHAEAYATVSVKARVGGEVTAVHFREGQDVASGDALFTIDPRPFEAALKQAQADLERDRARAEAAGEFERRYAELVKKEFVTQDQYDQAHAAAASLRATVKSDEAAVENARLQLGYCSIAAPIGGRTGSLLVHAGNVIKANDDRTLVVLNQVRPIRVSFTVPEESLPDVRARLLGGALEVTALPRGVGAAKAPVGSLSFLDNTVDAATGTLLLKATFPNADGALWPGQFVDVVLTLGTERNATVVPAEAVQTGQKGTFLYVVKADGSVEQRVVRVRRTLGGNAILAGGVEAGERVVTDGQLRLIPGAKVEIRQAGGPS